MFLVSNSITTQVTTQGYVCVSTMYSISSSSVHGVRGYRNEIGGYSTRSRRTLSTWRSLKRDRNSDTTWLMYATSPCSGDPRMRLASAARSAMDISLNKLARVAVVPVSIAAPCPAPVSVADPAALAFPSAALVAAPGRCLRRARLDCESSAVAATLVPISAIARELSFSACVGNRTWFTNVPVSLWRSTTYTGNVPSGTVKRTC